MATRERNNILIRKTHLFHEHVPQVVRACIKITCDYQGRQLQEPLCSSTLFCNQNLLYKTKKEENLPLVASGKRPSTGGSGLSWQSNVNIDLYLTKMSNYNIDIIHLQTSMIISMKERLQTKNSQQQQCTPSYKSLKLHKTIL